MIDRRSFSQKKRKAITERMKVQALIHRFIVTCVRCRRMLLCSDQIEWDHNHPLGLGGPHHYTNIAPLHAECHRVKTSGTKATSADSDIHKIAKVKRIAKGKMDVNRMGLTGRPLEGPNDHAMLANEPGNRGTAGITKHKWPQGRTMQSRPFQKRRTP